jgi:hypothetical protein
MTAKDRQWARGFARQAISDLRVREQLVDSKAEKCHRLHFLQMAAEKASKAFLIAGNGHENVKNSHAYIATTLPMIARAFYGKLNPKSEIGGWQVQAIRRYAGEIQLLAPALNNGDTRRDNSEYPWEDAQGNVCVPCEYSFPNIDDRDQDRVIVLLIRLIRQAAESYS